VKNIIKAIMSIFTSRHDIPEQVYDPVVENSYTPVNPQSPPIGITFYHRFKSYEAKRRRHDHY
jgi:hypothetical protein